MAMTLAPRGGRGENLGSSTDISMRRLRGRKGPPMSRGRGGPGGSGPHDKQDQVAKTDFAHVPRETFEPPRGWRARAWSVVGGRDHHAPVGLLAFAEARDALDLTHRIVDDLALEGVHR